MYLVLAQQIVDADGTRIPQLPAGLDWAQASSLAPKGRQLVYLIGAEARLPEIEKLGGVVVAQCCPEADGLALGAALGREYPDFDKYRNARAELVVAARANPRSAAYTKAVGLFEAISASFRAYHRSAIVETVAAYRPAAEEYERRLAQRGWARRALLGAVAAGWAIVPVVEWLARLLHSSVSALLPWAFTVAYSDSFNRSDRSLDGDSLDNAAGGSGGTWADGGGSAAISGNECAFTAVGNQALWVSGVNVANQMVTITASAYFPIAVTRAVDNSNWYGAQHQRTSPYGVRLVRVLSGTFSQLASFSGAGTGESGDIVSLDSGDDTHTRYLNGSAQTPATDSSIGSGAPGVGENSGLAHVDDFLAEYPGTTGVVVVPPHLLIMGVC